MLKLMHYGTEIDKVNNVYETWKIFNVTSLFFNKTF